MTLEPVPVPKTHARPPPWNVGGTAAPSRYSADKIDVHPILSGPDRVACDEPNPLGFAAALSGVTINSSYRR